MAEENGIERQLRQIKAMAHSLFPDDENAANRQHVTLLEQRVREMDFRVVGLPVKEMK